MAVMDYDEHVCMFFYKWPNVHDYLMSLSSVADLQKAFRFLDNIKIIKTNITFKAMILLKLDQDNMHKQ